MRTTFNPNDPSDVREFMNVVARLTASGPIGAEQAARMIAENEKSFEGRLLLANARRKGKISAESFGLNYSNVKVYSDDNPNQLQRDLQIQSQSANTISPAGVGDISPSSTSRDLIAHELTHVVQQAANRGLK